MKLCIEKWGKYNCHNSPGKPVAHVGNTTVDKALEVIDVGSTNTTFYVPISKLEYSVNAMAYDTNGNDVIIDLTGTGAQDACRYHIRIPSRDDSLTSWKLWLSNTQGVVRYRYWKLRSKGLVAFNNATQQFIVENTKPQMQQSPQSFASFYCHYVFYSKYNAGENKCTIEPMDCGRGVINQAVYDKVLSQDLGDYWSNVVVPKYLPGLKDCKPKAVNFDMTYARL